jgi:HPt (histidine-containing phosphotransfer) domain-containing protein
LAGNQALYYKLLDKFSVNHKDAVKEIRHHLDQGDLAKAQSLVHTIKGSAGNIGAEQVYRTANELEDIFKANSLDHKALSLENFDQALEKVFASITFLGKNPEDNQMPIVSGANLFLIKQNLYRLENLLSDYDMDAAEVVQEIVKQSVNTVFSEKATDMENLICQYDYEGALAILNEMIKIIGQVTVNGK